MAIYHLSTTPISRATGSNAVAAAAYRSGSELVEMETGQVFNYTKKSGVLSAEIVTPDGVSVPDREALWNAAERAERRKDSRVAREWRAALPIELDDMQRKQLAHTFAKSLADRYGVAVDVCIHAPDKGGDERNFHAHMLATTRKIQADGSLGEKAAIELGNKDRQKAGIPGTTQEDIVEIRAHWAELVNAELERSGLNQRIDHRNYVDQGIELTPTKHIGVSAVGMDRRGLYAERIELHNEVREDNARRIEEQPAVILDLITRTQAVFDRRDIARELNRYVDDAGQFQRIMAQLENSPELVKLAAEQQEGGRTVPAKYSTQDMIDIERAMIGAAERLASTRGRAVDPRHVETAIGGRSTLSVEQRRALEHVTGPGNLAVVVGDAGTGKSFAMAAAREAWETGGLRVRGCALSGKAADELQNGSGIESRTLYATEAAWSSGRDPLTSRDVIVVDEAGMVGSRQLGRILSAAEQAGAKVVLLGDDKQLAAIEAGAGFRAITEHTGAVEITEIRRQRESWAREASTEFARGDVRTGLDAYNDRGAVHLLDSRESAKEAVAKDWLADRHRGGSSIILAHANQDVGELNTTIRKARIDAGELGPAVEIETHRGQRTFAAGDRLVFMKNDAGLDVKNGTLGTVASTDGRLSVTLDNGREVAFDSKAYNHIDHGYAVTVHKSQGVTVDRAYVLATPGMDRSLAYVGMTRHRESATMYAGQDDFGSYDKLASGLSRQRPKESTLDFAERHGIDAGTSEWGNQPQADQTSPAPFSEPKPQENFIDLFGKPREKDKPEARSGKTPAGNERDSAAAAAEERNADKPQGRFAEMKSQGEGQERVQERSKELDSETMAKLLAGWGVTQLERDGKTVSPQLREALDARFREGIASDPQARARLAEKLGAQEAKAAGSASEGAEPESKHQGRFAEMKRQAGQERVQERAKELDAESMAKLLGGHAQMQLEREGKAVTPPMREAIESRVQQGIESDPQARARLAEKLDQEPKEPKAADAGSEGAGPESTSQGRFAEMKQQAEAQRAAQQDSQAKDDRGTER